MSHHTLFSDKADLYAKARPSYPKKVFSYLSGLCETTNAAWDCACGNGQAAIDLVEEFDVIYATDVSKEQIENAKQHARIHYGVAESEHSGFDDNSLDLICVAQALHWFDYELFWPEVKRVLKPGGVFTTLGYNLPTISPQIDELIQQQILDVIEPYWAAQNQLIWNHYRQIRFPFKKVDSPTFAMSVSWALDELLTFIHTFSATRRCMDKEGDGFFQRAYLDVAKAWGDASSKRKISFDFVLYVGINR